MLKLPLCPYCGARFLYPTVKSSMAQKTGECSHCKNKFQINRARRNVLFLSALILIIAINWMFLSIPAMNFPFLMVITAIGVIITYFLIPYTVRYKKLGPKVTLQENREKNKCK